MNIQYYGHSCFKITTKPAGRGQEDVNAFIDPFDKTIGLRPPQGQADLVLVTHNHSDHNNVSALKGEPSIIDIPGEYSVKGINVVGFQSEHGPTKNPTPNTIFIIESEDIKICHLGDLGTDLTEKQLSEIDGVDILMIPVGGNFTIDAKKAIDIVRKLEPKIVIPMHYKMNGTTSDIADEKQFCNEIGNCSENKVSKLNIKKKDLEEKNMEVVVMGIE
ncbi:MAG: MBL fold metallo-hydrolase [Candidatus Moranbacteria bacterium]|nr:MBL fold metallo-hydrolase [Candidatus Moranbacteria bacterium]